MSAQLQPSSDAGRDLPCGVAGTPFTRWLDADGPFGGAAPADLDADPRAPSAAGVVLVVEGLAQTLAARFEAGTAVDPDAVANAWIAGATRLLRHLHGQREHCLALDAEDLRARPEAAARLLAPRLGDDIGARLATHAPARPDVMALALGEAVAGRFPRAARLLAELRASCHPLAEPGLEPAGVPLPVALSRLSALREAERAAARDAAALAATAAALETTTTERDALREQALEAGREHLRLADLTAELDRELVAGQQAADALREAQAQARAQQAQAERALEAERVRAEQALAAERQRGAQALAAERQHKAAALAAAQAAAQAAAKASADRLQAEQKAARQREQALQADAAAQQAAFAAERARLAGQAALAQARIDDLAPLDRRLRIGAADSPLRLAEPAFAGRAGAVAQLFGARVGGLQIGAAVGAAPHAGLDLTLGDVALGGRRLAQVRLRLVEHHGHAGLAFFGTPGAEPPLAQWAPSGHEDGVPYVLLVPHDTDAQRRLAHFASADWSLILLCAAAVELALAGSPAHAAWADCATRVRRALEALPERWRYNALKVEATGSGGVSMRFEGVLWQLQHWPALAVDWRPAAGAALWLRCAADAVPLLMSWPRDTLGRPVPELQVPVQGGDARTWAQLPAADREVLVALLDALPAVATVPGADAGAARRAADTARALMREAVGLQRRLQGRQFAARLLRAGRRSPA